MYFFHLYSGKVLENNKIPRKPLGKLKYKTAENPATMKIIKIDLLYVLPGLLKFICHFGILSKLLFFYHLKLCKLINVEVKEILTDSKYFMKCILLQISMSYEYGYTTLKFLTPYKLAQRKIP